MSFKTYYLKNLIRNTPLKKQSVKMKSNGRATSIECQSQNTENTWISSTESLDFKSPPSEIKPRKLSSHSQKLSLKGIFKYLSPYERKFHCIDLLKCLFKNSNTERWPSNRYASPEYSEVSSCTKACSRA